jgi:hypothetical protein
MTPEDIHNLVPAFVGAALVILVVAGGVLIFVWRQYPPPVTAAAREILVDPERLSVKHGLRMSGLVVLALGVAWLCAAVLFGQGAMFGPASFLVPAAVTTDGLIFLSAAQIFSPKA